MIFVTTLSSISVMGLMILIGVLLRRGKKLTEEMQQLFVQLIINVGMPCIILASIFNFTLDGAMLKLVLIMFISAVVLNGAAIMGALILFRLGRYPQQKAHEMAIVAGLGNTAFIGIPLCALLFGPKGALLAAVFDAGLDVILWSLAVFLLQKEARFSLSSLKAMINIPMMAIVVGLVLGLMNFQAPMVVKQLTTTLAGIASPLAMIYIGFLVPDLWRPLEAIRKSMLILPFIYKLLILPLLVILGFYYWRGVNPLLVQVICVQMAMPCFTLASVLFKRYKADHQFGAVATMVSIFISLVTLPIMVYLADGLN